MGLSRYIIECRCSIRCQSFQCSDQIVKLKDMCSIGSVNFSIVITVFVSPAKHSGT